MSFADELVAAFQPWLTPQLEDYLRTGGEMMDEVEWYTSDTDDYDGWTVIFDPNRTKAKDLRWLGQIIGENIPIGHPEPLMREWIRDAVNEKRGSLMAILCAAQRHLTGTRVVSWHESTSDPANLGADVDGFFIVTYADQTPFPATTQQDILHALPGDIVLNYQVYDGQRWQQVKDTSPTWADVNSTYPNWGLVATTDRPIAGNSFSRPVPTE